MKNLYLTLPASTTWNQRNILIPIKGYTDISTPDIRMDFKDRIAGLDKGNYNLYMGKICKGILKLDHGADGNIIGELETEQSKLCFVYGDISKEPTIEQDELKYYTNFAKILNETEYPGLVTKILHGTGEILFPYSKLESLLSNTVSIKFTSKTKPVLTGGEWGTGVFDIYHISNPNIKIMKRDHKSPLENKFIIQIPTVELSSEVVQNIFKQLQIDVTAKVNIFANEITFVEDGRYTINDIAEYFDSLKESAA